MSKALYLTHKGEHTVLYRSNNNVCIKTSNITNYIVIILYSMHACTNMHTHTYTHRRTEGM